MNTAAPAMRQGQSRPNGSAGPTDMAAATKRLQSELMSLMMAKITGISAFPESDNVLSWIATIHGVDATPFQGLKFRLTLQFQPSYPYTPPTVRFVTPCYHPNIDTNGNICLDILKEKWSAVYNVQTVLLSIQSLLGEPNNDSPLNVDAASIWGAPEYRDSVLQVYNTKTD